MVNAFNILPGLNLARRNLVNDRAAAFVDKTTTTRQPAYVQDKKLQEARTRIAKELFGIQQQAAPAPAPAAPAPSSPSPQEPQLTAEAQKYREESEAKLAEAQKLLDNFKIEQNKAAEAKKLQEQMAIRAQGALASNLAMSQRKPGLQLSPASQTPKTAGTQPFKRRRLQVMTPGSQVTSGLNIGSANLLNV